MHLCAAPRNIHWDCALLILLGLTQLAHERLSSKHLFARICLNFKSIAIEKPLLIQEIDLDAPEEHQLVSQLFLLDILQTERDDHLDMLTAFFVCSHGIRLAFSSAEDRRPPIPYPHPGGWR